jgi:hypothetical protein
VIRLNSVIAFLAIAFAPAFCLAQKAGDWVVVLRDSPVELIDNRVQTVRQGTLIQIGRIQGERI